MKYVILIADGMGDYPVPELDGRTPLETAATPTMDWLARQGELLKVRTVPEGFQPGSDVANLSLLGYQPEACYTGRAPLEAASMGITLADDETAFRCNLVTLDNAASDQVTMIDYSAGHISTAEAQKIIASLKKEIDNTSHTLYPGVSYRHLLVQKGEYTSIETVPPHDYIGKDVSRFWRQYLDVPLFQELVETGGRVLASHEVNKKRIAAGKHPANAIWLWGEGKSPSMPTLQVSYNITGALISAVDLLKGIGVYAGMEIINVPGATGYLDTNYEGKAQSAIRALDRHDLVFVHVEAPDEAGHQGLVKEKIQAIEDFDSKIVRPVFNALAGKEDFTMVIGMDHYTPLSLRTHVTDPVPVVFYNSRHPVKRGLAFTEENAAIDNIVLASGREFFQRILAK